MTSAHNNDFFSKKFLYGLVFGLPIMAILGGIAIGVFAPYWLGSCPNIVTPIDQNATNYNAWVKVCQSNTNAAQIGSPIIGVLLGALFFVKHYHTYLTAKTLDRQNDRCLTCGTIIRPDDEYWYWKQKVYCKRHDPKPRSYKK